MQVSKERRLPPAETVVGNWDRDRYVDADHSDFNIELKLPRRATILREDRRAVSERILIDQL